eukprot:741042-Prymnesium_polylepis.1
MRLRIAGEDSSGGRGGEGIPACIKAHPHEACDVEAVAYSVMAFASSESSCSDAVLRAIFDIK